MSAGGPVDFAVAVPVGAWHELLPQALDSLTRHEARVQVAFLDASGDSRVADAADAAGIALAYRRAGPDAGQAAAIAEGWRETDAAILAWLNADDLLADGALDVAARAFAADPDLDVFYGDSMIIDAQGRDLGRHGQVSDAGPLLYRSNLISQPSCFVRRSAVDAIGGINPRLHYTMDWDLWARLYANGARFRRTGQVLSKVYWGPETKTASLSPARLGEMARLTARHAGPWSAAKTVGATIAHTLFERPARRPSD